MRTHLFTYGTLCTPDIMASVCGQLFPVEAAVVHGFRRRWIRGCHYPGMIVAPEGAAPEPIDGVLHLDIDEATWTRLDHYESDLYDCLPVEVELTDGQRVTAHAYILPAAEAYQLSERLWELDRSLLPDPPDVSEQETSS